MARLLKFLSVFLISIICFTNVVFAVERDSMGLEIFNQSRIEYQGSLNSDLYDKFYDCFIVKDGKLHFKCSDISIFANKNFFIVFKHGEIGHYSYPSQKVGNCPNDIKFYMVNSQGSTFSAYSMNDNSKFDRYTQLDSLMVSFGNVNSSCDVVFNTTNSYNDETLIFTFDSKEKQHSYFDINIVKPQPKPQPKPKPKPKPKTNIDEKPPHITGDISMNNGDGVLDGIVNVIKSFFKVLAFWGKKIIAIAIGLGIIFVGAKWLWRKLREWLNSI